jgi:hypothetical protein
MSDFNKKEFLEHIKLYLRNLGVDLSPINGVSRIEKENDNEYSLKIYGHDRYDIHNPHITEAVYNIKDNSLSINVGNELRQNNPVEKTLIEHGLMDKNNNDIKLNVIKENITQANFKRIELKHVLTIENNTSHAGLNVFDDAENTIDKEITINLDLSGFESSLSGSPLLELIEDPNELVKKAALSSDFSSDTNLEAHGGLQVFWNNDVKFSKNNVNSLITEINKGVEKSINNILGNNLSNFITQKRAEQEEEIQINNNYEIMKMVSEVIHRRFPVDGRFFFEATNANQSFDTTNNETVSKINRGTLLTDNGYKQVINESDMFEPLKQAEKNNSSTFVIKLSEKGLDYWDKTCQEMTKKYYGERNTVIKKKTSQKI